MHIALVGPSTPAAFRPFVDSTDEFPAGLGGTPVNELGRALLDAGHEVDLITADPSLSRPWSAHGPRLGIESVPYRTSARARALDLFRAERTMLAERLARVDADVVHAHWTYEFALAALAVRPDALVTAHDAPVTILRHHRDRYRVVRLAMAARVRRRVRHLAVVSPYVEERWRREMWWRGPVSLLPNIAPPLSSRETPSALSVLTVGDDGPRKNVRTLLEAWPRIVDAVPGAHLDVVGPGLGPGDPLPRALPATGRASVSFHGPVNRAEVDAHLRRATLLVHPSLEECHPMTVLEAMSAGVPVLAGRASGGVPWTLGGGTAGRLCDVSHPGVLAEAVVELLSAPATAAACAASARDRITEHYSASAIATRHLEVYDGLRRGTDIPKGVR